MSDQNPHPDNSSDVPPPEFQRDPDLAGPASPRRVQVKLPELTPYVTYVIMGLTIFVFLLQLLSQYTLRYDLPVAIGVKDSRLIAEGQYWRLFTPMLLHGDIIHIAFNMYALRLFGPSLERFFGHGRFILLYLVSGFGGNVISMMFTEAPSLGSSTAIFGLLGAEAIFLYQNRKVFGALSQRALRNILSVAAVNLVIGLSPGIDNWGHIGGLTGGAIFTWFAGPLLAVVGLTPYAVLEDERDTNDVILGFAVSGGFFVILTLGALFLGQ